jgi:hypothetical protein
VPADSEIVIEGLIDPELLEPEGPFGESHGYIALEDFNMSMQVTAITRKRKPVFVSILSEVTPSESSVVKKVAYEPMFLSHLRDKLSSGRARVVMRAPFNCQGHLRAMCAEAARKCGALRGASTLLAGAAVIAVSGTSIPADAGCSGRSPIAPIRSTTCIAPIAPAGTGRNPVRMAKVDADDRRHAQVHGAAARCRRASSWSTRAIWES